MNEKPIERLNYYNGQRLEADDLKLEQEYHIRVRRWLNKSLYSAGIAHGLEVQADKANPQQVIVSPGLALDVEGREMILLEEARIQVVGQKSEKTGGPQGNYLYIQYREETREEETDYCEPKGNGHKHGQTAWGGPSRVRAEPILGWSYSFPHESSGKVVLAQVDLDDKCNVRNVFTYPRRYIGPASEAKIRQYALEGERHIDSKNPGRIYFHIRGRQPKAVTLYLRAEMFSTLFYTEMGKHSHSANVSGGTGDASPQLLPQNTHHKHDVNLTASKDDTNLPPEQQTAKHNHDLFAREGYLGGSSVPGNPGADSKGKGLGKAAFFLIERDWPVSAWELIPPSEIMYAPERDANRYSILPDVSGEIRGGGQHSHPVTGKTELDTGFSYNHTHTISGSGGTGDAGVSDPSLPPPAYQAYTAHGGAPLTYVDDLQVYIGKVNELGELQPAKNYTPAILEKIRQAQPANAAKWNKLGNGNANGQHIFATNGTGPIALDLLSKDLSFPEGEYYIDLQVTSGGGRIVFNLYLE